MIEPPADASPTTPSRRHRVRWLRLFVVAVLLVAGGTGAYASWAMGGSATGSPVRVIVPEGANGAQIAAELAANDVVRSAFMFRLVARYRGVAAELKPGAYDLRTGLGVNAAIDRLLKGVPLKVYAFTIPEGKTIPEIATIVARATPIGREAFLREARGGEHRIAIMPKGMTNLEGLLFPKTYEIVERTTAGEVVDLLLDQFEKETAALDFGRARALGVTPYEAVIAASLIEREAKVDEDRALISSVIFNRLEYPQRLQIDATVQYAILLATGHYKHPLLTDDYTRWRSPYNTYLNDGLPPGPIASPGLASLEAALHPAESPYRFYKLSADGRSHCFGVNGHGTAECENP